MIINNKDIPVYLFNGQSVFLAYEEEMPNVKPLDTDGQIGAYSIDDYNGCPVCDTTDETYEGYELADGTEIVCDECANPQNYQGKLDGWWSKEYSENDGFDREYLTTTDRYYEWSSERSHMIKQIEDAAHEGVITAGAYNSLKAEWDKAVTEAVRNCSNYTASDAPFDALLDEAGVEVVKAMTVDTLTEAVLSGAVYTSNADPAHTDDYPDDRDDIIKTIREQGFRELDPDTEDYDDYADALARLDLFSMKYAVRIFTAGCYTFAPDSLYD